MTKNTIGKIIVVSTFLAIIFVLISRTTSNKTSDIMPTPNITTSSVMDVDTRTSVFVTYYGWSDNDPPGTAIAYPQSEGQQTLHQKAAGVGTYQDPVTFAADPKIFPPGTLIYVPYIKKYAIMEDWCAGCIGRQHIDIWAGGDGNNPKELNICEENATRESEQIILNPKVGFEIDSTPIFDEKTSKCLF